MRGAQTISEGDVELPLATANNNLALCLKMKGALARIAWVPTHQAGEPDQAISKTKRFSRSRSLGTRSFNESTHTSSLGIAVIV